LFLALAMCALPAAAFAAPVGFTHISVPGNTASRGDAGNQLSVTVWYPAAPGTPVQPLEIGPPGTPYFSEGQAAENGPIASAPARMPFVVVSHGTGGTSTDLSWLCAGLAANGYIVASVTHPGNNALEPPTVAGTTLWWLRADDLSKTIDGVLANSRFAARIDETRIGAAGFSLGGYTVLAIAGARGNPLALDTYCETHGATPVCSGVATPTIPDVGAQSRALAERDPAYRAALLANTQSHRDARVKAVFSIAPALGPAIVPESLKEIAIPVAIVDGVGDAIVPPADNAIPDARGIEHSQLTLLARPVGHYTFLTDCAPAGKQQFPPICEDAGAARVATHEATLNLALAFFGKTLANR